MQAIWQALQPMHLVTSISLATSPVCAPRAWGGAIVVAERRMISSDCSAIVRLLCLLDLDEERFELRRLRIAVADRGRKRVREEAGLRHAGEAPMDRDTDLVQRLAIDRQLLDAL